MQMIRIVTGEPGHFKQVLKLWEQSGIPMGPSESEAELARCVKLHPQLFLVALANGRVCGAVLGTFDGRRGYVNHLAVAKSFRRQGLGEELLEVLMNQMEKLRAVKVHLFIEPDNLQLTPFYEKRKFQRRDLTLMTATLRRNG